MNYFEEVNYVWHWGCVTLKQHTYWNTFCVHYVYRPYSLHTTHAGSSNDRNALPIAVNSLMGAVNYRFTTRSNSSGDDNRLMSCNLRTWRYHNRYRIRRHWYINFNQKFFLFLKKLLNLLSLEVYSSIKIITIQNC